MNCLKTPDEGHILNQVGVANEYFFSLLQVLLFPDSQFAEFSWHCLQIIHLVSEFPMHNGKPHWHNVYITDAQMEPGRFSFKGFVVLEVEVVFFVTENDFKNRNAWGIAILFFCTKR